ncbi:MAG: alpha/beta hydrolase [Bacteroidota bacterium]
MRLLRIALKWCGYALLAILIIFFILLVIPEREVVPAIEPTSSTAYWQMSEGFDIAYQFLPAQTDSAKSPVIYLHGGPGGYVHSSIVHTLGALTALGYPVYFYDQRGSGRSDRLEKFSDVSFEKHLSDLHEIITQHIGAEQSILMGQSFGTNIIAHYASRHPGRVEKMILSSPGTLSPPRMIDSRYARLDSLYPTPDSLAFIAPDNPFKESNRAVLKPKAIVATTGALLFDAKFVSDKQMDRILNGMASKFTKGMVCDVENVLPEEGGGGLYAYLATNNDDVPDPRGAMATINSPVLVLQGQCDYVGFARAYEYVDLFPNASYAFIENAGHEIWWEEKEVYLSRISDFLD